jgi:L-ornithine N5-oxygenase
LTVRDVDLVGVGLGPSNLALALAVSEHNEHHPQRALRTAFLERQPAFGWHLGMMLEGATMQVSFLKDLATMRNPTSKYTFVNYLHEHGRLPDFINQKDFFPTRIEFNDYLKWCAGHVDDLVCYDREVTRIRPLLDDSGSVERFQVDSRCGSTQIGADSIWTRNVVIATGLVPRLPAGTTLSDRVWHSSQLMSRAPSLIGTPLRSIAVVGSGQSAAEAAAYLHQEFTDARIHCVMQRYGYSQSDNTPFANRVFDPSSVDEYYAASPEARGQILTYHSNTNYSVVDESLITELYRRQYRESVSGTQRLIMCPLRHLTGITERADGRPVLELTSLTTDSFDRLEVDLVVLATGYKHMDPSNLIQDIDHECLRDANGRLQVSRYYKVVTTDVVRAGVYVQGGTEHTHGLSASLLSNVAVRAGEILGSVAAGNRSTQQEEAHVRP